MFTLAHLSDIHLGPVPRPQYADLFGKRMLGYANWQKRKRRYSRQFLDRLTADLARQRVDHIAITGDLVNISLPEEFLRARTWLESLGSSDNVTVIPGNHDAYVRLRRDPGIRRWDDFMRSNLDGAVYMAGTAGAFPFVRCFGGIAIVGLSSAVPTMPFMASGKLGHDQLARLGPVLDALRQAQLCRVILIHHPPLPGMSPWKHALHDARAVRGRLMHHGAELILHGHSHADSLAPLLTPHGPVFVVGVAAASSAFRARYNLFTFQQAAAGWQIHMRSRTLDQEGQPLETDHGILAIGG